MNERIEKKLQQIAKLEKAVEKYGANLTEEQKEYATSKLTWGQLSDLGTEMNAYRNKAFDLRDAKATLVKLQNQEKKRNASEEILKNLPQVLKEWAKNVEEEWNAWDIARKEFLKEQYNKMGYKEFRQVYSFQDYQLMQYTSIEGIKKENKKAVESLVLNLYRRVIEITGDIENVEELRLEAGNNGYLVINGYVFGKDGKAKVESIEAGGYNIQRWHIRTLVKEVA